MAFYFPIKGCKPWLSDGLTTNVSFDPGGFSYGLQKADSVRSNIAVSWLQSITLLLLFLMEQDVPQEAYGEQISQRDKHFTSHPFRRSTKEVMAPVFSYSFPVCVLVLSKHAVTPHLFLGQQRNMAVLVEYCRLFWHCFHRWDRPRRLLWLATQRCLKKSTATTSWIKCSYSSSCFSLLYHSINLELVWWLWCIVFD